MPILRLVSDYSQRGKQGWKREARPTALVSSMTIPQMFKQAHTDKMIRMCRLEGVGQAQRSVDSFFMELAEPNQRGCILPVDVKTSVRGSGVCTTSEVFDS